jgi:hypothetical protein
LFVAVDPVFRVLLPDRQGFRLVPVALHDAERSRDGAGGAERENRRGRHPRVVIRIDASLGDRGGKRRMRLQIPVGFVVGLPDAAEVGLAFDAGWPRGLRLTGRLCDGRRNDGADSGRRNGRP